VPHCATTKNMVTTTKKQNGCEGRGWEKMVNTTFM
jgi:hypothetical protein